jgi:hypothetical protein
MFKEARWTECMDGLHLERRKKNLEESNNSEIILAPLAERKGHSGKNKVH